ncbi:diguanylate cyclase [Acidaminobacter sp. JC074]|uniref:diguanylate cyclase domain-containing protein n=1 Tax=Acidaminobacter sp. JC074 TaxID=2530199 RepID=UPI001F0D9071|nr:diguanylate cyclase [Acidaminobacter sp. JC074]MCH4887073.1 diguanylate cyclase [Acidaminobacter sp. JC074]
MIKTIKKNTLLRIGLTCLIIMATFLVLTYLNNDKHLLESGSVKTMDDWTYMGQHIEVGEHLHITGGQAYTLTSKVPEDYKNHYNLLLRSSLSHVHVAVDDYQVYDSELNYPQSPMASIWHIVELPENSVGKTIRVTYQSPYEAMNGVVNPVTYGSSGNLKQSIVTSYGQSLAMAMFILFIGIVLIFTSFVNPTSNAWHVGLFAVFISFWLISESRMLQFVTGNQVILASSAFISLALIPMPFLSYIKGILTKNTHKTLDICGLLALVNLFLIIGLQIFHVADFFETVVITHGLMIGFIATVMVLLYREIKYQKNEKAKQFFISLSILFGFIALEMARFYILQAAEVTSLVTLGLLIFILNLGYVTGKDMLTLYKKSYKAEFYERLAYLDQLTQGPNRTAYERDLEDVFFNPHVNKQLRLVILDVNQLKTINDQYGHIKGDEAIRTSFELIQKNYQHLGSTYRIGGDEFAVIITKGCERHYDSATQRLLSDINAYNDKTDYPFSISLGSVAYKDDVSVNQFMHRADTKMYVYKRKAHEFSS